MNMETINAALGAASKIEDHQLRLTVIMSLSKGMPWTECVGAFHALYDCPNDVELGTTEGVTHMSDEQLALRIELIDEEFKELKKATADRDEIEMADALGDIAYVVCGYALEMGVDLSAVVREIQASNMTKLGADGKVIRRDDGKILKGPNYRRPNIKSVLRYRA